MMTYEQKQALHRMFYYQLLNNTVIHPMQCYIWARDRANYCLEALGESLDEC